jgi:hypothetical protein
MQQQQQRSSWPAAGSNAAPCVLQLMQQAAYAAADAVAGPGAASAPADAVVAVSIEEPQDGLLSPRLPDGCGWSSKQQQQHDLRTPLVQKQQLQPQQHQQQQQGAGTPRSLAGCFSAPTNLSMVVLDDPSLKPLRSFSATGSSMHMLQQQQQLPGSPSGRLSGQQQVQAVPLGSHRVCDVGGYTPPRSASPIAAPARHGMRRTGCKLPPAPFTAAQLQQQEQQQQQEPHHLEQHAQ